MATHKTDLGTKWDVGVAINRTNPIPLDSTQNHSSLDTLQTYATSGATSYVGQQVNVIDSNGNLKGAYIIKNKQGELMELASSSSVESLSGVFTFKGVAYDISPDNTYILLNGDGFEVEPIGTACDIVGNTYFGWKIDIQEVWTTGPLWVNAVEYTKSDTSTTVYGMTIDGTLYFVSNTQPDTTQGTLLESLDGRCVWLSGSESIEGWYTDLNPLGVQVCNKEGELTDEFVYGYVFKYNAYVFTESEEKVGASFYVTPLLASDGTKTDGDGNKIPNNSGHVYQIGENEYASNGTIWVKLGSPVEDWIIL